MSYSNIRVISAQKTLTSAFSVYYNAGRSVKVDSTAQKREDPQVANARPYDEIPEVPSVPLLGSAWAYLPIVGRYNILRHHKADQHKFKTYGTIVRENFGPVQLVSSFDPDTMKIFCEHEGKYPIRGEVMTMGTYRRSRREWYTTLGVMLLNGKEWHDLRFKIQKHMMKPQSIQAFLNPMQDVTRDMVSLIRAKRDSNSEVEDLLPDLSKWALESLALVGLDARLGCLNPNLDKGSDGMKMVRSIQTQFECFMKLEPLLGNIPYWKYFPSPTWKKYVKASDDFAELAFKYINRSFNELKNRKDKEADLTLLQSMLMNKDLDVTSAMVMVADMLMAGIDTTSTAVGFFLYALAKNPEHQERVFKEIIDLLPRKGDRITPDIFNKLHYLKACIKESIRLYPNSRGVARTFDHDVAINGYRIPASTTVFCILQVIYRNEKYFKNADKFVPERWLNREQKIPNPFAYVPFGVGTRACIGRRLAELEITCLASEIIRNFVVEYHYEDLDIFTRLVNIPDKPLKFKFIDRL